jgi:AcrR family transcriptional regulator
VRKRENLKEELIEAAIKLFLAKGSAGTTTNELAGAVGVSKGALYWHFKGKDDLIRGVIDKYASEFIGEFDKRMKACKGNFVTRFKEFYNFTIEFSVDHGEILLVFTILLMEFAGRSNDLATRMKKEHLQYNHIIQGLIEDGIKDGSVPKEVDPPIHAAFIAGTLIGSLLNWYLLSSLPAWDHVFNRRLAIIQRDKLLQAVLSGETPSPVT